MTITQHASTATLTYVPASGFRPSQTRLTFSRNRATVFDRSFGELTPSDVALVRTRSTHGPLVVVRATSNRAPGCPVTIAVLAENSAKASVRRDTWCGGLLMAFPPDEEADATVRGYEVPVPHFDAGAPSAWVAKMIRIRNGTLVNDPAYGGYAAHDAELHLRDFNHRDEPDRPGAKSSLYAYLIDMCRSGRCDTAWATVRGVYRDPDRDRFLGQLIGGLQLVGAPTPHPATP